ncbi:MAG: hypothetical protein JNK31_00410, partial [Candidatus Competibacter sp.]|nr:hypothetical protein [Candidatus Competibacter sp.]
LNDTEALQTAADAVSQDQIRHTALPRRYSLPMREIWEMQQRLATTSGKRPLRVLGHPRFRAAYDFLLLRADADEQAKLLADWWTQFLALDEAGRLQATQPATGAKKGKPRRRRKPRAARKNDRDRSLEPET